MFSSDATITDLKVRERDLIKALFSTNIHQVATPELSAEDARCYIFFFREGSRMSAYIALYYLRTDRKFYYAASDNPFSEESFAEVEGDARGFVEDMGFVLDEVNFSGMSADQKHRWIDEQDIFAQKKQPEAAPPPQVAPEAPAEPAPAQQPFAPRAWQAPAPAVRPAEPSRATTPPAAPEPAAAPKRPEDLMQQGIRAGVVRPPKSSLTRVVRDARAVVGKDQEALARLLASF